MSSYKHKDLHQQTQSVVLEESALLSLKIEAIGQDVVEQTNTVMMEETGLKCREVNEMGHSVVEQMKASIAQTTRALPSQIEMSPS